jgi:hypothetical protein
MALNADPGDEIVLKNEEGEVVDSSTVGDDDGPLETEAAQARDDDSGSRGFRTVEEINEGEPAGSIPVDNDDGGGGSSEPEPEKVDLTDPGEVLDKVGDNLGKNAQASLRRADKFGRSLQEVSTFSQEAAEDALVETAKETKETLEEQEEKIKSIESEEIKVGGEVKDKSQVLDNIEQQQQQAEKQTHTIKTFREALDKEENRQAKINDAKENPNIKVTEAGDTTKFSLVDNGETVRQETVQQQDQTLRESLSSVDRRLMETQAEIPENNTKQQELGFIEKEFTEADNVLASQALQNQEEIRETAIEARKANQQLDPESFNPVSVASRGAAAVESTAEELLDSAISGREFEVEDARNVDRERVQELQGDIGAFTAPLQRPVETLNLIGTSTGRILTSPTANEKQQISPDVDAGETASFLSSTLESAKDDPTRFAIGAGLGFGLERSVSTAVRSADVDSAIDTFKNTGERLDPATGIGRRPRPGEQRIPVKQQLTESVSDAAPNQLNQITGFLKGDLTKTERARIERPRREGEVNILDTDQFKKVADGNREGFERRFNDLVIRQIEEEAPQTRTEALKQFADQQLEEIQRFTQADTSKGQATLKPKTKNRPSTNKRRIGSEDRRQDVAPRQRQRDIQSQSPRNRFTNDQPTSTRSNTEIGIGAALGAVQNPELGQTQNQDISDVFGNPQDNKVDQTVDNQIDDVFRNPDNTRVDTPQRVDNVDGGFGDPFRRVEEERVREPRKQRDPDSSRNNRVRPGIDFGLGFGSGTREPEEDGQEARFAPSLDSLVSGRTVEDDEFDTEQTFSGLESRPIIVDDDEDENSELERFF